MSSVFVYAHKPKGQEQFIINLDKENFLIVYNKGKKNDIEAIKVSINSPENFEKVNLPKKITSLKGKLDQFINIGHDNILILATNEGDTQTRDSKSEANFVYIYSVKDLLDDIGKGIYPAVAGLPFNTNMVMFSQDKKDSTQKAQVIGHSDFKTLAVDNSQADDLSSVATIYNNTINLQNAPYFIYETNRHKDNSVWLNTYSYNEIENNLSLQLDKSIEIDKG